jgi:hypothetical protein
MRNRQTFLFVLAGTLLLIGAGCAGSHRKTLPNGPGKIVVEQTIDLSGGLPIEGEISYAQIETTGGGTVTRRLRYDAATKRSRATIRLGPGSYRLVSYQRTCDGNCRFLDPPSTRCSRGFTIAGAPHGKLRATVHVSFSSGCTIAIAPAAD